MRFRFHEENMKSKYKDALRESIDLFWINNHYPPTMRDLIEMVGHNISTSHVSYLLDGYDDIRRTDRGKVIPKWVDDLFQNNISITK
jgi:hypothetical protein